MNINPNLKNRNGKTAKQIAKNVQIKQLIARYDGSECEDKFQKLCLDFDSVRKQEPEILLNRKKTLVKTIDAGSGFKRGSTLPKKLKVVKLL